MRGLIWETKQEWEWCLGKSPMTSARVLSLLYFAVLWCKQETGRGLGGSR